MFNSERMTAPSLSSSHRQLFFDVLSSPQVLIRCNSFQSLVGDWQSSVSIWRDLKQAEDNKAADQLRMEKQAAELKRSLRDKRNSDFLMADEILKNAHEELDALLKQTQRSGQSGALSKLESSSCIEVSRGTPAAKVSYIASFLASSCAPKDIAEFDSRLPEVVPPPYYQKVMQIVSMLNPNASVNQSSQQSTATTAPKSEGATPFDHLRPKADRLLSASQATLALPYSEGTSAERVGERREGSSLLPISLIGVAREVVVAAIQSLGELIDTLTPNTYTSVLFNCRAACHYVLGSLRLCLRDCHRAAELASGSSATGNSSDAVNANRRALRCCVLMGNCISARETLRELKSLRSTTADEFADEERFVSLLEKYSESVAHNLYHNALGYISTLTDLLPEAPLVEKRIEMFVKTSELSETLLDYVAEAALKYSAWPGVWYWYGVVQLRCSASFEEVEQAQRSLQRAISLSGLDSHPEAKAELQKLRYLEAKAAMAASYQRSKRWRQAVTELTILITLEGLSKGLKIHFTIQRANAFLAMNRCSEAMFDANYLVNHAKHTGDIVRAYLIRSEVFVAARDLEKALSDAKSAVQYQSTHETRRQVEKIESLQCKPHTAPEKPSPPPTPPPSQRRSERTQSPPPSSLPKRPSRNTAPVVPPHYTTLQVSVEASTSAVTKAYRDAALKWHPDRWVSASDAEKQKAEEMFKSINAAYQVLVDPLLRRAYNQDNGLN